MSEPIESSEEEIIGGTVSEGSKVHETREVVRYVDGVPTRNTVTRVSFASCGHPVRNVADIGGRCQAEGCTNITCAECFRQCDRCGLGLCNTHQKRKSDGNLFCGSCNWKIIILGWRGSGPPAR